MNEIRCAVQDIQCDMRERHDTVRAEMGEIRLGMKALLALQEENKCLLQRLANADASGGAVPNDGWYRPNGDALIGETWF